MNEAVTVHEIEFRRVYDAPRGLVWKAWTEPDQIVHWWGPHGWSTAVENVTIDARPGGTFRLASVSEDGAEMTTEGTFREVVEPERLVLEEAAEQSWHEGAVSVITLTELDERRTEMVLRATINTTDEMRGHAEAGLASALDRLGEQLEG
jgi:uncharacterized protein YndB with AHSA1/START domain